VLSLDANPALSSLPKGLFSKLCSLNKYRNREEHNMDGGDWWLDVTSLNVSAFANMTFAGWPYCEAVFGNPAAKEMCEAQQGVFVEGSCAERGEGPER
jgi:hypothetical protein